MRSALLRVPFPASVVLGLWLLQAQTGDVTALRQLTQNLHDAYQARDVNAIVALFSAQAPQRTQVRDAAQRLLGGTSPREVKEITVGDPEIAENRARIRIEREVGAAAGAANAAPSRRKLVLEAVKEPAGWKLWREISAAQDLSERLAALPADNARDSLLTENGDLTNPELVTAITERAREARYRGDFAAALSLSEYAYRLAERIGDTSGRALSLINSGLVYYGKGDYSQALEHYRRALALSESLHDEAGTARALNDISAIYLDAGELSTAWEYLQRCLAIGEKLHDDRLVFNALGNMAIVHARRGDYKQAFALMMKSHDMTLASGDKRSIIIDLQDLGNLFFWQDNYPQARDYFQKVVSESQAAQLKPLMAVGLMSIGRVSQFDNPAEAIAAYQKSLAIFQELGDKSGEANNLAYIGLAYEASGDFAKSLEYFQRAVELLKSAAPGELPLTLTRMADVYNWKGDYQQASRTDAEALSLAENAGLREVLWSGHLGQGIARRGLGDSTAAETEFNKAIAIIEDLRLDVAGGESEREGFFEDKLEPYHRMLDLLVAQGRNAEAFQFAERAKARVLLDVFKNGRAQLADLMTADDRQREENLGVKLAALNAQVVRGRGRMQTAQFAALTKELEGARLEYETFETDLYSRHPEWKLQTGAVEPVRLEEALGLIPEADTAFVEFVVTENKVFTLVGGGGSAEQDSKIQVFSASIRRRELEQRVEHFRQQLAGRDLAFRATASDLYRLLLAPAERSLLHKRNLILVPDGVLWELPFQALVNSSGRYLLEDAAISYAPSLTALKAMRQVRQERRRAPGQTELFAMGNPTWGGQTADGVSAVYRDQELGNLPLAETEVQALGKIYGAGGSHVFVGKEATETRFKAEAGEARVLHLATHGILNNSSPLYSYLLLAGGSAGSNEDGLLEARELLQMKLRAELVVLSACETARGRVGAGEGLIGLSWALFVSGVPSTVLSQWKVESASTSRLMVAFHQNRRKGMSDAEALRAAALAIRKDPSSQHPFYWAPFIAIGAAID